MTTANKFKKELYNKHKIPCFEIEVFDNRTNQKDWVLFNIEIYKNNVRAQHIGLTVEEEESDKISFKSIDIDDVFSLEEHLQELYDICIEAIINSDFFSLTY